MHSQIIKDLNIKSSVASSYVVQTEGHELMIHQEQKNMCKS